MSETGTVTSYTTDTLLGMINQHYANFGGNIAYNYLPNTTLNKKYSCFLAQQVNSVWQNVPRDSNGKTIVPTIAYFGVGIRGYYNITSDDGISPLSQAYRPKATDKDLYRPIPIRCVPKGYDLSAAERANYRMRTEMVVDGVTYICYYLKKVTLGSTLDVVQVNSDGTETDYSVDGTTSGLNPTPTAPTTPEVLSGKTKVVIGANVICRITGKEILEAINVIYHGDPRRANISEWGLYTGGDYSVTNSEGLNYTEALYCQLAVKRCTIGKPLGESAAVQEEKMAIQNGNLLLID